MKSHLVEFNLTNNPLKDAGVAKFVDLFIHQKCSV